MRNPGLESKRLQRLGRLFGGMCGSSEAISFSARSTSGFWAASAWVQARAAVSSSHQEQAYGSRHGHRKTLTGPVQCHGGRGQDTGAVRQARSSQ